MQYEHILVESRGPVGLVRLNRPKAMNALSNSLMAELGRALADFDADEGVGATVLTGGERAFAAGADIRDMQGRDAVDLYVEDFPGGAGWSAPARLRKPLIAAVAGAALGGGCELAMACDFIIAADNAQFGQPEIKLGTMPGAGGTQRLARAIGKAKAMEMCLTGRLMDAAEAERLGLVARVVPLAALLDEALKAAEAIAAMSWPAVMMVKEAINAAFEVPLREGLRFERRLFQATFSHEDCHEGIAAFVEKRQPHFKNR